jgi:hypothetical protein
MNSDLIAAIAELITKNLGKSIISQLGLLKTNDIRLPLIEPRQKPQHALLERIDVPGGEAHTPQGNVPPRTRKRRPVGS